LVKNGKYNKDKNHFDRYGQCIIKSTVSRPTDIMFTYILFTVDGDRG